MVSYVRHPGIEKGHARTRRREQSAGATIYGASQDSVSMEKAGGWCQTVFERYVPPLHLKQGHSVFLSTPCGGRSLSPSPLVGEGWGGGLGWGVEPPKTRP